MGSEIEKMRLIQEKSQAIGEFLEWLQGNEHVLAKWKDDDQLVPVRKSIEQLLADYFDIDLKKVEEEKQAILEEIRNNGR